MSTFHTSRGTRGQHVQPKFQTAPYKLHPARREHIYGKVQPMESSDNIDFKLLVGGAVFGLLLAIIILVQGI